VKVFVPVAPVERVTVTVYEVPAVKTVEVPLAVAPAGVVPCVTGEARQSVEHDTAQAFRVPLVMLTSFALPPVHVYVGAVPVPTVTVMLFVKAPPPVLVPSDPPLVVPSDPPLLVPSDSPLLSELELEEPLGDPQAVRLIIDMVKAKAQNMIFFKFNLFLIAHFKNASIVPNA
jgi:hypothetical protein